MSKKLFCLFLCFLPLLNFAETPIKQGKATFYARSFVGKKTTSGERYDPEALTAAHATLPLHSYVQVRNLQNGKSVIVRINDRMSRNSRFVIDVSKKAAHQLGIVNAGMGNVKISRVDKETALALQKKANEEV
ncbi:septal ring lytic transglycosylase RlpA family protein [Rufibacter soli]